jgi:hypothetical protein
VNRWDAVNLALALVVAGLLALLWLPRSGPASPVLLDIDTAAVALIRVERRDQLTLQLERDADGWRLTYPVQAAANPVRVARLLAIARAPVVQRVTPAAGADYGLAPGSLVVQFDRERLTFGDHDPAQRYRYVEIDGDVAAVDATWYQLAGLPAGHYRME